MATKIIILGGGFGGLYAALEFEKHIARGEDLDVTLVNRDNFFLFTPMLHEVAASDLDPTHIVNPIHKLLKRVKFFCGSVDSIDVKRKVIAVSHGLEAHSHELEYDHLVLALGSITNFFNSPGVKEFSRTMKSLEDAMGVRAHLISLLEEADFECCKHVRHRLLSVVVAGAGFAGVETVASIHDFLDEVLHFYPNIRHDDLSVILVNSGDVILPELDARLGRYAEQQLSKRGIRIISNVKVARVDDNVVSLTNGEQIAATTLVWTAGTAANPLIKALPFKKEREKIVVNEYLQVGDGVWALGDCAAVPDKKSGKWYPPTAQHACRQGPLVARNIVATINSTSLRPFRFQTLGQLASLGRRCGVANILGMNFSGFIAWWLWRTIYLLKLPRFEKKFRVALDWSLDLFFSKDLVQWLNARAPNMAPPTKAEGVTEAEGSSTARPSMNAFPALGKL